MIGIGSDIAILGSSTIVTGLLGFLPTVRRWWVSLRQRPGLALLLIVAIGSTFLGGARESGQPEAYELIDTIRLVRMVVVSVLFLWAVSIVLRKPRSWRLGGPGMRWMFLYSCITIISTVYSLFPALTLWKAFEVLTVMMCGYATAAEVQTADDIRRLLDMVLLILLFLTVTVLMGAVISPERAFRTLFEGGNPAGDTSAAPMLFVLRGLAPEINAIPVGGIAASLAVMTAAPFFAQEKVKDRFGIFVVLMIAGTTMVLAHTRTPIFALTATVTAILVVKRQFAVAFWIALAAIIILLVGSTEVITEYIFRGQSHQQFASLTGRTIFWEAVLEKYLDAPFFGYGFYAGHRVLFNTSGVDNTYVAVLLGVGIVGIIPFVASIFYAIKTLLRTMPRRRMPPMFQILWLQLFGIFSITFIRSLTGTTFEVFYHLLIFYLLIQISLACLQRQLQKIHTPGDQRIISQPRGQRILATRKKMTVG